jgi:hypothetical protein
LRPESSPAPGEDAGPHRLDQREEHQDLEQEVVGESAETVLHVQDLGFSAWGNGGYLIICHTLVRTLIICHTLHVL